MRQYKFFGRTKMADTDFEKADLTLHIQDIENRIAQLELTNFPHKAVFIEMLSNHINQIKPKQEHNEELLTNKAISESINPSESPVEQFSVISEVTVDASGEVNNNHLNEI
jgi:hypothetical protein